MITIWSSAVHTTAAATTTTVATTTAAGSTAVPTSLAPSSANVFQPAVDLAFAGAALTSLRWKVSADNSRVTFELSSSCATGEYS